MNMSVTFKQLHERDEIISMWGLDAPVVPPSNALRQFVIAFSSIAAFGVFCKYALIPDRPSVPREYPFSGLVKELGGLEENKVRFLAFVVAIPY